MALRASDKALLVEYLIDSHQVLGGEHMTMQSAKVIVKLSQDDPLDQIPGVIRNIRKRLGLTESMSKRLIESLDNAYKESKKAFRAFMEVDYWEYEPRGAAREAAIDAIGQVKSLADYLSGTVEALETIQAIRGLQKDSQVSPLARSIRTEIQGALREKVLRLSKFKALTGVFYHHFSSKHLVESFDTAQRYWDIYQAHSIEFGGQLGVSLIPCKEFASISRVELGHSSRYVKMVIESLENITESYAFDNDTSASPESLKACFGAVATACMAVDQVAIGEVNTAFCIIRPPGHHAGYDGLVGGSCSQGFCFFNNIAISALYALNQYPWTLSKIAIVDFDVHHGDGTQDIIKDDPRFMFFSLHAYAPGFYPGSGLTHEPDPHHVINLPLLLSFKGDDFLENLCSVVIPGIKAFDPDLIMISAGFDGRIGDMMTQEPRGTGNGLTPQDYYESTLLLTRLASEVCQGRVVSMLEGGYGDNMLSECALAHTSGLVDGALESFLAH